MPGKFSQKLTIRDKFAGTFQNGPHFCADSELRNQRETSIAFGNAAGPHKM
jgi:hypothetical protein